MILLSHILDTETPTYGQRDCFIIEETSQIKSGDSVNSSRWTFTTNHLGTHIDMPKHFYENGQSLTDVPVDFWCSDKVQLVDIPCSEARLIEESDSPKGIDYKTEVLLIRTGYEQYRQTDKYWNDNPGLSANLGKWLRENRPMIKIVGFDFISLTSWKYREEGKKAHQSFLDPNGESHAICVIEDMSLLKAGTAIGFIVIAPIFVESGNGGIVTVFAQTN
jgi:arylformamidase